MVCGKRNFFHVDSLALSHPPSIKICDPTAASPNSVLPVGVLPRLATLIPLHASAVGRNE